MMDGREARQLLTQAAQVLPVVHRDLAPLRRQAARRRQRTVTLTVAGAVLGVAAATAVITVVVTSWTPSTVAAPAASGRYDGGRWQLTRVSRGDSATEIPLSVAARLEFQAGGRLVAYNGINTLTGRFAPTREGFEVSRVGTTDAGYAGTDAAHLAAIAALNAVAYGNVTVVEATGTDLIVRADDLRLTFRRVGTPLSRIDRDGSRP